MTDLGPILARLGLDQYHDAFIGEGFDSWKTLLDITESDLDALNVKLGHRRKLQRAIAEARGISYERSLGSPALESLERIENHQLSSSDRGGPNCPEPKRKYRRHPKADENAPDRPPSAYVIFSNKVRDEVKGQNLSFTEIAKLVGEKWQMLSPTEKEPFETQANTAKETYVAELTKYKKTDLHKRYLQYLADFKAKHGGNSAESKRPKLDKEDSGGSGTSSLPDPHENLNANQAPNHTRIPSSTSQHSASLLASPTGDLSAISGQSRMMAYGHGLTGSPGTESPPILSYRESRSQHLPPSLTSHLSSASDASMRSHMPTSYTGGSVGGYNSETSAPSRPWSLLQHQDTSASSMSSFSYRSGSPGQKPFATSASTEESPWLRRTSSTDVPPSQPSGEFPLLIHPPLASHPAPATVHSSHNTLPLLKAPDNLSRRLPDPQQSRVLPPPTLSPLDSTSSFLTTTRVGTPTQRHNLPKDSPKGSEDSRSPLESSENEAASSLAALAYGVNTPGSGRDRS